MSAGLLERPRTLFESRGAAERRGEAGPARARLTLEERLDSIRQTLRASGVSDCPACGAEMTLASDDGVGECGGCGSRLS